MPAAERVMEGGALPTLFWWFTLWFQAIEFRSGPPPPPPPGLGNSWAPPVGLNEEKRIFYAFPHLMRKRYTTQS